MAQAPAGLEPGSPFGRGKAVLQEVFAHTRPGVWVSDALGSQRGHGGRWQMCLAHLLCCAQHAVDCGGTGFGVQFRLWLLRALAIGKRRIPQIGRVSSGTRSANAMMIRSREPHRVASAYVIRKALQVKMDPTWIVEDWV